MALTLKEQLQISTSSVDGITFLDLVYQGAVSFGATFQQTVKDVNPVDPANPTPDEVWSASYKSKMLSKVNQIINAEAQNRGGLAQTLNRVFDAIVGLSPATLAQVQGATEAQVEAFINAQIKSIVEALSGVYNQEKDAYDAL